AANFIENHDQPRATTKYLQEHQRNKDAVKMLGAMYFFLRGTPFIYQGQELGMVNFERDDVSQFNDLSSIDQYHRSIEEGFSKEEAMHFVNLRSRDNSRTPFPWDDSTYAGFSDHTPWLALDDHYKEINALNQVGKEDSIYEFYKEMIDVRQHSEYSDCLIYGDITPITTQSKELIAYRRTYQNTVIDCYFNFSNQEIQEESHVTYDIIFQNLKEDYITKDTITLQPFQAVLLKVREYNE
ncbi:MAG: alpha-amylase family glycosyl hydrolase, partial [Longicatena sp.]